MRRVTLTTLALLAALAGPVTAASILPSGLMPPGPLAEAMAAAVQGKLDEAERQFIALRDANPRQVTPWLGLAEVAARRNDTAQAEARLREGLAATGNGPELHRALGRLAAQMGNKEASIAAFTAAQQARPGDAVSYMELAEILQETFGDPQRALPLYDAALARDSRNWQAAYGRGLALARSNQEVQALTALSEAARIALLSPLPDYSRAQLLLRLNRHAEALIAFEAALARGPTMREARLERGMLLIGLGRGREAVPEFERLLAVAPEDVNARLALGMAHQALGDAPRAEAAFRAVLAATPQNPIALNNLAWMAAEHGRDLDQALAWAESATAVLPHDASVLTTLGWVRRQRGELRAAEAALARAVTLQSNADRLARLGIIRAGLGQRDPAMADLRRALATDPDNALARQELRRLEARR